MEPGQWLLYVANENEIWHWNKTNINWSRKHWHWQTSALALKHVLAMKKVPLKKALKWSFYTDIFVVFLLVFQCWWSSSCLSVFQFHWFSVSIFCCHIGWEEGFEARLTWFTYNHHTKERMSLFFIYVFYKRQVLSFQWPLFGSICVFCCHLPCHILNILYCIIQIRLKAQAFSGHNSFLSLKGFY